MEIKDILKEVKSRGYFQSIVRYKYTDFNIGYCLQVVEAMGKERNPKFEIDEENRFVYENIIRWIYCDPDFKCLDPETKQVVPGRLKSGLYIAGNTGSGKSWALEIMSAFCDIDNVRFAIEDNVRRLAWPCFRVDAICDEYVESGKIEKYKNMPIVAFQDLGAEPSESVYMGNRVNVLCQILEYRGDRTDQITLISSNLSMSGEKLKTRYGDRVVSRLNEMCNYLELRGKDRRKEKK